MLPAGVHTVTVSVALNINFPSPTQIVTLLSGQTVTLDFAGTY
jgi:hypothetical protein